MIHEMYQKLQSDKNILKIDLQVAKKNIYRKDDKITLLEQELQYSKNKNFEFSRIIKKLKVEFQNIQHIGL